MHSESTESFYMTFLWISLLVCVYGGGLREAENLKATIPDRDLAEDSWTLRKEGNDPFGPLWMTQGD